MEKVVALFAFLLLCGMLGSEKRADKRTYCYGFTACIAAVVFLEVVKMLV